MLSSNYKWVLSTFAILPLAYPKTKLVKKLLIVVIGAVTFLIAPILLYLPVFSNISITSPYLVPQNIELS